MNRPVRAVGSVLGIGVIVGVATLISDRVLLAGTTLSLPSDIVGWHVAAWTLLSGVLLAGSVAWPAYRSTLNGRRLTRALFLAVFGLHVVLVLPEGLLALDTVPTGLLLAGALRDTMVAGLLALLIAHLVARTSPDAPLGSPASGHARARWLAWRLGLSALVYFALYVTAGVLIYPQIRPFYESQGFSVDAAVVLPLQLVRGPLYVLFVLPLLQSLAMSRWQASLSMAIMVPVLAGVAALTVPNPIFPDWIRHLHLFEIGWSNFVYGAFVGFLFWRRRTLTSA